jgi:LPXTG-motif cell wall-anchored protein
MRKVKSILAAAAAVLLIAGVASAQNADPNTGGPTKNTLRLRLVEPREGAQISGSSIRVAVDYNRTGFGQGQGTKFGDPNFPQPRFDVYVDNLLKETLKGGEKNVTEIVNVPFGTHKVAVVAKNVSGEIIDRAEVTVTNVATAVAESTTTEQTTAPAPPPAAAPAPAPEASTTVDTSRSSMSTTTTTAPDTTASTTSTSDTLPRTGSNAPAAALLGATLLAAGLYVSRRRV